MYFPNLSKYEFGMNLVSGLGRDKTSHQVLSCVPAGRRVQRTPVEGILGDPWSSTGPMAGLSWLVLLSTPFNSEGMIFVGLINFKILLQGGYSELGYWMWHERQAWSLHQVPISIPQ